ncbi:MAG: hypothetical protein HY275_06375, partial [Gemmatimonadetes bacterium]|nr:hypothetical protein [Gemmatimonadota bacterium]
MTDTHLEPADIELLLDDEHATAAAPLAAHVARCDACRAAVEEARFVAEMLSTAPHLKPTREFTDRIMGGVQVSSPWHVAVGDSVRAVVPEKGAARTGLLVGAVLAGLLTTAGAVWVALRADQAAVVAGILADRGRALGLRVANEVAGGLFGPTAVDLIRQHGLTAV